MKNIFNILIINCLILTNTFGQDSLKSKNLEEVISIQGNTVLRNLERTKQILKEFSREESRFVARNYSNRYNNDNSEDNPIEKKKVITKSFTVDAKEFENSGLKIKRLTKIKEFIDYCS